MLRSVWVSVAVLATISAANAQTIYWTESSGSRIRRINIDGSGLETILSSGNGILNPRGIAVDVEAGKMYWADDAPGQCTIRRANLDGSNIEDICGDVGLNPDDIVLNISEGKMYVMDPPTNRILRLDLDGTNPEEPVPPPIASTLTSMFLVNPSGNVPALSITGLGIMLLFIVAVGGFVFKRVRLQ